MQIVTKDQHIAWIKSLIEQNRKLLEAGFTLVAVQTMAQTIEIFGSYLDSKPMRAKEQSANRFNTAIYQLFPPHYAKANRKSFLYLQLRTSLIHTLSTTNSIKLLATLDRERHLVESEELMQICSENLCKDVERAADILVNMISAEKVKLKKIAVGSLEK